MRSLLTSPTAAAGLAIGVGFVVAGCSKNPADDSPEAERVTGEPRSGIPTASPDGRPIETYVFTGESSIEFTGSQVTGSQQGNFQRFEGHFSIAGNQLAPGAEHRVVIDMTSCITKHPKLTAHLKGPDFFDVERYPTAEFVLHAFEPIAADRYRLTGDLTLHGITETIRFPASITQDPGTGTIRFVADFFLKRFDYGIVYPGPADDLIRNEVVIRFDLHAARGAPGTAKTDLRPPSDSDRSGEPVPRAPISNEIDLNGDGKLGSEELRAAKARLEVQAVRPIEPRKDAVQSGHPVNSAKKEEIAPVTESPVKGPSPVAAAEIFERLDQNRDGRITADESGSRQWEILEKMDRDEDGAVTVEEISRRSPASKNR